MVSVKTYHFFMARATTLAFSWWHPDHTVSLYPTISKQALQQNKVTNLKIWFPMIWPMPVANSYLKGIYGYGYSEAAIAQSSFYRTAIKFFNDMGLGLDIETVIDNPGIYSDIVGRLPASVEAAKAYGTEMAIRHNKLGFNCWKNNGGLIDTINLDDPLNKIVVGGFNPDGTASSTGFITIDQGIEATLAYMKKIKEFHPSVKFNYTTNLPPWKIANFPSQSAPNGPCSNLPEYTASLGLFLNKAIINGTPIQKLSIDNPYPYAKAMPNKLITFSLWLSNFKTLKQELIINTASTDDMSMIKVIDPANVSPAFNAVNHAKWNNDTIEYTRMINANLPLINSACCQTWMNTPLTIAPLPGQNPAHCLLGSLSTIASTIV